MEETEEGEAEFGKEKNFDRVGWIRILLLLVFT